MILFHYINKINNKEYVQKQTASSDQYFLEKRTATLIFFKFQFLCNNCKNDTAGTSADEN